MSLRECQTYSVVEFVGGAILEALKDGKVPNNITGTTSHDNSMEAVKEEMMKEPLAVCLSISLDEILCKNNLDFFAFKFIFFFIM